MKACSECPFIKRADKSWRGYLGEYRDGAELHALAQADTNFKCHKDSSDVCRGYALYMSGILKRSRVPEVEKMQGIAELAEGEEILSSFDGSKISEWHTLSRNEMDELMLKAIG